MEWYYEAGIVLVVFIALLMWVLPIYNVWSSRKSGEAELAEAEFAEKVAIAQANARRSAAEANKEAEVIEAEAVSESIKKIGNALQNNAGYLQWQWIKTMSDTENQVIYVPTEASLPILEAGKRDAKKVSEEDDEDFDEE